MQTRMWLAMVMADGGERLFPLTKRRIVIGRDTRCDLRVALPSVCMRHCEIVVDGSVLRLNDLGSLTGTFHNGARVERATLAPDDRLTVGPVTFVVRTGHTGPAPGSALSELKPLRSEGRSADAARRTSSQGPLESSLPGQS